jgi:3,4-dihydroxy 2-butanone 4-phosphate synthase
MFSELELALTALSRGDFVLIHDSKERENEIDLVVAAQHITPDKVATMRREAGGLICVALSWRLASVYGLPYLTEILRVASSNYPFLRRLIMEETPYGGRPAFSITVNHRGVYTGISDAERSYTISRLAEISALALSDADNAKSRFYSEFSSPSHVHLLVAARNLLEERRGHTELSVFMAERAGVTPVTVLCEMLDSVSHRALGRGCALRYAEERGIPFVEGDMLVQAYRSIGGV